MQTKSSLLESGANGADAAPTAVAETARGPTILSHEFHKFVADVEDLIKATTSLTGDELAKARARLNERLASAKRSVEQVGSQIADRARNTARETDEYVHEQPWKAIGIGAGIGLLLGLVLARRK